MAFALDTPWERLFAFAVFYICEGIPQGFTEAYLPTHFAKADITNGRIGDFGWWDGQPWAWKWLFAPLVDVLSSRRNWLFGTQIIMALTLLPLLFFVDLTNSFSKITATIFVHNIFSALQDVAIDAIAVGALPMAEGPAADGVMFAAQEFGNALGGSVALMVSNLFGYTAGCLWVIGLLIFIFVTFTCRLRRDVGGAVVDGEAENGVIRTYLRNLQDALFGPGCGAFWSAVLMACFPSGTLMLRGPHCKSKMVADSLRDADIGMLELAGKVASITTMLSGGFLSNTVGARRLIAIAFLGTVLVNLTVSLAMSQTLTFQSWLLVKVVYHFMHGFHIGPQMSLFRSCCTPAVAATQFTMFCALCNNADSWGKTIAGHMLDRSTFQHVLLWDAAIVVLPVLWLPFLGKPGDHQHME